MIDVTPACEDANSKLVEVVSGSDVDAEKRVDDSLVQIWKLKFGHKNITKGTTDPRVEIISPVQTQILINFHLQNSDHALTSKCEPKFKFMTKLQLPNLHKSVVNVFFSISINISNSNSINKFELASSHARVTSIKFTKQESVSA